MQAALLVTTVDVILTCDFKTCGSLADVACLQAAMQSLFTFTLLCTMQCNKTFTLSW